MGSKTSLGGAIAGGVVGRVAMGITTTACAVKAGAAAGTAVCLLQINPVFQAHERITIPHKKSPEH